MAVVWYLSSMQFQDKTLVSGVIMKRKPLVTSPGNSVFKNALMILSSYFRGVCSDKKIKVALAGQNLFVKTNEKGGFQVTFDVCSDETPKISLAESDELLDVLQNYPVNSDYTNSKLSVVSDIDETIMVSFTSTKVKRFLTTLFKTSQKRKVIPFTQQLYKQFNENKPRFFYVSKSESNLFPTISNFILYNKLPTGGFFLTPYLSFWQLLTEKKDRDFKLKKIRFLIENSPGHTFVLIGDDSQRDTEIYYELATRYKDKISDIYIRQTRKKVSEKQTILWNKLLKTEVNAYYFKSDEILDNLKILS
jgi:phosphatidate phosphatase APP1